MSHSSQLTDQFSRTVFKRGWLALALFAVAWAVPSLRAEEAAPQPPVLTTPGEFWNLTAAEKQKPQPVRMEFIVFYYDPSWQLLWGESGGNGFFLPTRGRDMQLMSGQLVRLEGTVVPADGLSGDRLTVTVLNGNALPAPLSTAGRVGDFNAFNARWVEMEGYVFDQSDADATHQLFLVVCGDQLVTFRLQVNGSDPIPQLAGARIRFRAVYIASSNPAGNVEKIDCWTARRSDIDFLGWFDDDERFKLPLTTIDQLATVAQPWVRLVAQVRAQQSGASLTVRDETGQITMAVAQPEMLAANTMVEIIGRPVEGEMGWTLENTLFRKVLTGGEASVAPPLADQVPLRLRLADQVLELPVEEAEKGYSAVLRGTVTWINDQADFFYLQDASGGVRIRRVPGQGGTVTLGARLLVTGATVRGAFVPEVVMRELSYVGTGALPPVRSVTLEQALSGAEEGQLVEMRGFVRRVEREERWTRLNITTYTGEFSAFLPLDETLGNLEGALVRVRGICTALANANRELTDVHLWVMGREAVLVDESAPADPFAATSQTIAGMRQFSSTLFTHRVRLTGTVLLYEPGRYLYLQDATGGLFVFTRESDSLRAGDQLEVVGFPGRAGNRLVIREAIWRQIDHGSPLLPEKLSTTEPRPEMDARLVQTAATLRQAVAEGSQIYLTLQSGDTIFDAILHDTTGWVPPGVGSLLELTGVYVLEFDEYRRPHGYRLELRAPADIRVLASPPWWNARRTGAAVGGLLLIILLVMGWGVSLRRRVREQTEQIRRQLEKEARLQTELERSSRLESLGVLAGGIAHDFNNLLTAILGNLGLAAMDKRAMAAVGDCIAEAERGARRARDVTQQLLTFAKGGDPVRSAVLLPEVVSEAAGFARHGSNVRFDFDYPPDLPPGNVDAGQISRVVHNLVINAVQAMPDGGVVSIALAAVNLAAGEINPLSPGTYLRLTISDTGKGIAPEHLSRIFDPYFSTKGTAGNSGLGLATVRSIIKKHCGHIEVDSRVNHGTTFRIWLPAAQQVTVPAVAAVPGPTGRLPARILVMDDEDVIRRVAGRMLSLAGHETAFAADGSEAVQVYTTARKSGRPFDLVIFDLTVPGGMGGKDALQELRKLDPGVRAVASSGYSSDPVMANPHAFDFRACLPKPYDIPDLMRVVEEARR